ncbi:hypothetical protein U1Q18_023551, partial [Sarracenia purpurea var. burkii]
STLHAMHGITVRSFFCASPAISVYASFASACANLRSVKSTKTTSSIKAVAVPLNLKTIGVKTKLRNPLRRLSSSSEIACNSNENHLRD